MKTLIPLTTNYVSIVKIDAPKLFLDKLRDDFSNCQFKFNVQNYVSEDIQILKRHKELNASFSLACHNYVKNIFNIDCERIKITKSWFNKSEKGQFHHWHRHFSSIVSGVFFLEDNPDNLNLTFKVANQLNLFAEYNQTVTLSNFISDNLKDHLIMFPSSTYHSVSEIQSELPRKTLSFDTWFDGTVSKGQYGEIDFS
ncbi:MAG: hypothetical protein EBR82_70075 [Caulobacteraceae bacterium]|nr:hypothetical protein [Caulobacteraceae bacterium]